MKRQQVKLIFIVRQNYVQILFCEQLSGVSWDLVEVFWAIVVAVQKWIPGWRPTNRTWEFKKVVKIK